MTDWKTWEDLAAEGDASRLALAYRADGLFPSWEVADRLQVDGGVLHEWTLMGKVIGIPVRSGYLYPSCQFEARGFILGMAPLEALKAGKCDQVLELARRHREE